MGGERTGEERRGRGKAGMGQDERGGKGKSSSFALGRKKEVGACRQVSTHDGREA